MYRPAPASQIRRRSISLLLIAIGVIAFGQPAFKEAQLTHSRVKEAYDLKFPGLLNRLTALQIDPDSMEMFIVGYKEEKDLEVWVRNRCESPFQKLVTYRFCMLSGQPGPKRREGDRQVPEGFYHINDFNPYSKFHLSLGINYPNRSDRVRGEAGHLGGQIYLHGSCASIGCIPITTDKIKELYILCVEARKNGQESIPVHLYPARLEPGTRSVLIRKYEPDPSTCQLWEELQISYDYFTSHRSLPQIRFLNDGSHLIRYE